MQESKDVRRSKFLGEIIGLLAFMGIMGVFLAMSYLIRIAEGRAEVAEKKAAMAAVTLKEYQTIVHALDRCEENQEAWYSEMYDLKTTLAHWENASLYVDSYQHAVEDAKKFCSKCAGEKETQLMDCYVARDEQCWCLEGEDSARITSAPSYESLTERIDSYCKVMEGERDPGGSLWSQLCVGVRGRIPYDYNRYFLVKP